MFEFIHKKLLQGFTLTVVEQWAH